MASIQKRVSADGKTTTYRVQVRLKGHAPEVATFERQSDAKEWAQKIEADIKAGRHFGQSKRHTFADLADEYKKHAKDQPRLEYWRKVFGPLSLDQITRERIAKARDKLATEETQNYATPATGDPEIDAARQKAKRSGSTVNRFLASLSVTLSYAVKELGWLEKNPCLLVSKPSENKGRVRFLSDEERIALLAACKPHQQLYLAVVLSLSTGARQAEIMTLRYGQINFERKTISLTKTKNGELRTLPLVGEAFALLQEQSKVRTLGDDRVFPPKSRAKKSDCLDLRRPWIDALKAANIENFHWHDLRHTSASYLVMSGVSLVEVAAILGHKTLSMVARYSHLADGHIVSTGEKLAARLGI